MPKLPWFNRAITAYARASDHPGKVRLLNWILRLTGHNKLVVPCDFGVLELYVPHYIPNRIFWEGVYEPLTLGVVLANLKDDDCFVDVGANLGQYSVAVGNRLRETGRVIAIEPNPIICADLIRNRELNDLQHVMEIVAAAVGPEKLAPFGIPEVSNPARSMQVTSAFDNKYYISIKPLSDVCRALGVQKIDWLKIDVEGFEFPVIRSILETGPLPKNLLFEYISEAFDYSYDGVDLLDYVRSKGYSLTDINGSPLVIGSPTPEYTIWARHSAPGGGAGG